MRSLLFSQLMIDRNKIFPNAGMCMHNFSNRCGGIYNSKRCNDNNYEALITYEGADSSLK